MAREAKTIITAEDKTGPGIKSAINNVLDLDGAAKKLGKTFATSITAAGLVLIGKQVAEFGVTCYQAFAEAERAAITFSTALADRTDVSRNALEAFNDAFSKSFGVDGEAIMGMETMLLASGRTEDQITKMMNAAQALSVATGKDLSSSVELLNKSFSGSEGKLGTLIPALKDLTDAQLRNGQGVDVILEKFGHLNSTVSEMADTKLKNFKNAWEDLTEAIGGNIATWLTPMINGLTELARGWTTAIEKAREYGEASKKAASQRTLQDRLAIAGTEYDRASDRLNGPMRDMLSAGEVDKLNKEMTRLAAEIRNLNTQISIENKTDRPPQKPVTLSVGDEYIPLKFGPTELDKMLAGLAAVNIDQAQLITDSITTAIYTSDALAQTSGNREYQDSFAGATSGPDLSFLKDIFDQFGDGLGSAISSLASFQQILNPITTIIAGFMEIAGPVINEVLAPIIGALRILGKTVAVMLLPATKALAPVLDIITKAFVWLYNYAIMPLANAIIWVITTIYNGVAFVINGLLSLIDNINILGWSPDVSYRVAELDYNSMALQPISESDLTSEGTEGINDTTAANNATYTGSRAITFNFYNQGNVVGAGGLEELAAIINALIQRDARYA